MRKLSALLGAIMIASFPCGLAHGQSGKLMLSPLMMLASDAPQPGGERVAFPGDALLTTKVKYRNAVGLANNLAVKLHGLSLFLGTQTVLRQADGLNTAVLKIETKGKIYCSGLIRLEKDARIRPVIKNGRATTISLFDRNIRVCLIDDDSSSSFDRAFIHGALLPENRSAVEITPARYQDYYSTKAPGMLGLRYVIGGSISTPMLEAFSDIHPGDDDVYVDYFGANGKKGSFDVRRRISGRAYPFSLRYQDATITILSFDPVNKSLRYRIDSPLNEARIRLTATDVRGRDVLYTTYE